MISIIITSCKESVKTLQTVGILPFYDVIVSKRTGLGLARNFGAKQAKGSLLLFLDDDLYLDNSELVNRVLSVGEGEFAMTFLDGFPCTRVLAVHKDDFWSIGGFDERIRFTGEDRDFYVRALNAGLRFKPIPIELVYHQPHLARTKNIHIAIGSVKENVKFVMKYWRSNPEVFKVDFLNRLKRGQFRTLLLQFIFFLHYAVRRIK